MPAGLDLVFRRWLIRGQERSGVFQMQPLAAPGLHSLEERLAKGLLAKTIPLGRTLQHALADQLPTSEQVTGWLEQVDGPTDIKQLGLTDEEGQQALDHAHFFRARFTANKLFHVLGLRLED